MATHASPALAMHDGPTQAPGAVKLKVYRTTEQDHTLLRLEGTIDEEFAGEELAAGLSTRVLLLELGRIRRLTSFGIREWVQFIKRVSSRTKRVYLVDCSPRVLAQLNMVMGFVGSAEVISLMAPYGCDNCGATLTRRMDVIKDQEEIRKFAPADYACEVCGSAAVFDEDAERYFSYVAAQSPPTVPSETAAFLERHLDYQAGDSKGKIRVAKLVEGDQTVIQLMGELNDTLPLDSLKDGLEGSLALDLYGLSRVTAAGSERWLSLLKEAFKGVDRLDLFGCPPVLLTAVREVAGQGSSIPFGVYSVTLPYRCGSCGTFSSKEVDRSQDGEALAAGTAPEQRCDLCGHSLECVAQPRTLLECSELPLPTELPEAVALVQTARKAQEQRPKRSTRSTEKTSAGSSVPNWVWPALAGVALVAIVAVSLAMWRGGPGDKPVEASTFREASDLSPPPWRDREVYEERGAAFAVGVSTLHADKATAFAEAENTGLDRLMMYALQRIDDAAEAVKLMQYINPTRAKMQREIAEAAQAKQLREVDTLQQTFRTHVNCVARSWRETARRINKPRGDGKYWESYRDTDGRFAYRVWARLKVSDAGLESIVQYYSRPHEALGAKVSTFFPGLCWLSTELDRGALVQSISAASALRGAGLRARDIVVSINDQRVSDGAAFSRTASNTHQQLRSTGGTLSLKVVDFAGEEREVTVKVAKAVVARPPPRRRPSPRTPQRKPPPTNLWDGDPSE